MISNYTLRLLKIIWENSEIYWKEANYKGNAMVYNQEYFIEFDNK